MPKKEQVSTFPTSKSVRPGLLALLDLTKRFPERAKDLIDHELLNKERDLIRTQETKYLLSWHPWHTIRFLILSGTITFFIAWFLSFLSELGKLVQEITAKGSTPIPFLDQGLFDVLGVIPRSSMTIFAQLPDFGAKESFIAALIVILVMASVKGLFILVNWKKIKKLSEAEDDLIKDIEELGKWMDALTK